MVSLYLRSQVSRLLSVLIIDWISLEIDGVVRGEVYLEMTYFSSAPAPPASLMDHHGQDLSGRPSKLSPSERLYRPPQSGVSHQNPQADNHPSKSASQGGHSLPTSYSPSTSGDSALSPLLGKDQSFQILLPGVLKPGGASRPHQTLCNASKVEPPSVLRPGAGKLPIPQSPNPAHIAPVSPSPGPYRQLPFDERSSRSEFTATNPYLSAPSTIPGTSSIPAVPPVGDTTFPLASYSAPTDVVVFPAWDQVDTATSNPSFPVPMVSAVPQSNVQAELYQAISHQQAAPADFSSPIDRNSSSRYQVPLPLPQDVGIDTTSSPPHSRPSELRPNMEVHRKAEEDVQKQERRDLELALDLDRQLNS